MPPPARSSGVIAVALALALAGCGSAAVASKPPAPRGVDPVAWVDVLCGGLGDAIVGVSAIVKAAPTPQGQKDGLLQFSDTVQRAFENTALKLERLGQPRIAEGKRVQDTAVGFFTTAARTVGTQRAQLAALDAKDPNFEQKATHLPGPDLGAASGQIRELTSNKELASAFGVASACRRLNAAGGHR